MISKTKHIWSLALNLAVVLFSTSAIVIRSLSGSNNNMFNFFTNDSNILLIITAALMAVYDILALTKTGYKIPSWVIIVKLVGTVGTTLTFLTVVFYLLPVMGPGMVNSYGMACLHIISPLFAVVSLVLFENDSPIPFVSSFYGMIPMVVYAIVIIPLVAASVIEPPYPFTDILHNPWYSSLLASVIMLGGTYLISFLLYLGNKKCVKLGTKKEKKE